MVIMLLSLLLALVDGGYFIASALKGDLENTLRIGGLTVLGMVLLRYRKVLIDWLELPFQILILLWVIGGFYNFYETIWWYDEMTHFVGPALLALYGLLVLRQKFGTMMPAWLYAFCLMNFIVMLTVVWEFYEYFVAYLWLHSFEMELGDTITDLLLGYAGAGMVCFTYYYRAVLAQVIASWQKILPWVKSDRKSASYRYS